MSELLFDGLKVLDVGTWIAGPVAGTMLADFGADVIKVEIPGVGDQYRTLSAIPGLPEATSNYMWEMDARNKRSIMRLSGILNWSGRLDLNQRPPHPQCGNPRFCMNQ